MATEDVATVPADAADSKPETATDENSPATAVDMEAVQERLSFFFSAANIRQDAFLRRFLTSSTNKGNPRQKRPTPAQDETKHADMIPVATLLRFNTLSKLTKDPAVVVEAATMPALADQLVVSEDKSAIGLKKPWTDEQMDDNIPLTLVVGNLPLVGGEQSGKDAADTDKKDAAAQLKYANSTDEVKGLFVDYGKVALCRFRFRKSHGDKKSHRGGPQEPIQLAFVEFESQQDCEKAAAETLTLQDGAELEPKRKLTLGDTVLTVRTLKDYVQERKALKEQEGESNGKKRDRDDDNDDVDATAFTIEWKPGCVIRLEGLPGTCDREAILAAVAQGLDMTAEQVKDLKVYADYSRGQTDGAIRFMEPDKVAELCAKLASGDVTIGGAKVSSAKLLEGDDEKKYWDEFIAFKNKQIHHKREEKSQRKKKQYRR